jgi:hypothetical protein
MRLKLLCFLIGNALCLVQSRVEATTDFDQSDTNGDGVISREEFAARKLASEKSVEKVPPKPAAEPTPSQENQSKFLQFIQDNFEIRETFFTAGQKANDLLGTDPTSLKDSASTNPARISWTRTASSGSFYQVDAAVLWKPKFLDHPPQAGLDWLVQPNFEAHISTKEGSAQDQLTYRVPVVLNYTPINLIGMDTSGATPAPRFITTHRFVLSPIYQTNRKDNTRTLQAELYYTPTIPSLASGIRQPLFGSNTIQFLWRPYIGFEFGDYVNRDAITQMLVPSSISRFVFRGQGELMLGDRFTITGSFIHRTELNGDNRSLDYGELSGVVALDPTRTFNSKDPPHFTAGVTYKRGKDAPDFDNGNETTAWVGVQF